MAKKAARTLGRPDAPCLKALHGRVAACPKPVLAAWCLEVAQRRFLPVYKEAFPGDARLEQTLDAARAWLRGENKLPFVRNLILNAAHAAAREAEGFPAAQAAARAVAHAASAIHAKRHALGLAHYGAAALAYAGPGSEAPKAAHEAVFARLCLELDHSLSLAMNDTNREEETLEEQ